MSKSTWRARMGVLLNGAIMLAALAVLLVPEGLLGQRIAAFRKAASERRQVEQAWPQLIEGARIDDGAARDVVVVFSDYQCTACKTAYFTLLNLMDELDIGVVHRHAPSPALRPRSGIAAVASICAEAVNGFPAMHAWLNSNISWEREAVDWQEVAEAVALPDPAAFVDCLSSEEAGRRLAHDQALANQLEISATPTFLGKSGIHVGVPTREDLARIAR